MAAACNVGEPTPDDILEAQIVAQAITELQEIHAPIVQNTIGISGDDGVVTTTSCQGDTFPLDTGATQTQVIYYIEDGTISRTEDRTLVDSSVQANDYEIERRSGRLPARRRVIPIKFRDYKNTSNDENSDSDYDPDESVRPNKVRKVIRTPKHESTNLAENRILHGGRRSVGRPRKHYMPTHTASGDAIPVIKGVQLSEEAEQKYKEAIKLSQQQADKMSEQKSIKLNQQKDSNLIQQETNKLSQKQDAQIEMEANTLKETVQREEANDTEATRTDNIGEIEDKGESGVDSPHNVKTTTVTDDSVLPVGNVSVSKVVPVMLEEVMPPGKRGRGRPRGVSWERMYKCPYCEKSFNQKGNLRVHIRVHTSYRPFPCQEEGCGKSFRSNESLRRHLLSHQGIKPFQCDICFNKFSSNVALTEHRSRHYDEKPHVCPHCQRRFRQVSCLRRHVTTHSNSLPYRCDVCQKQFAQPAYLKSHMKVHTGEKPFFCEICDKRFAHQSDVKRHKTTHTGEKPYTCGKCQAKFSDVSSKNRHEKEHESSKRYTCQLCNDTFKRTGQLRSHLNRKHSHTFAVKIEKSATGAFTFKMGEEGDPNCVTGTQQRIVSLIKNLHSKTGFTELVSLDNQTPTTVGNQSEVAITTDHVTDISQLEKEVDASVIESDMGGVPIELQGVEIQGEGAGQSYIAITDLADSWTTTEGEKIQVTNETKYRLLYEITEDGQQKQVLVPYIPEEDQYAEIMEGTSTETIATQGQIETIITEGQEETITNVGQAVTTVSEVQVDTAVTEVHLENMSKESEIHSETIVIESHGQTMETDQPVEMGNTETIIEHVNTETSLPDTSSVVYITEPAVSDEVSNTYTTTVGIATTSSDNAGTDSLATMVTADTDSVETDTPGTLSGNIDYVTHPDFSSQEYYNWLTNFTELCKVVPMPLDMSLFQKISQVHKTLSDVMATPSGVIADRENFRVLMNISKELSTIINEHLFFVLEKLTPEEKNKRDIETYTETS